MIPMGKRSPQMVSAQGASAQKEEHGKGHAREQPGIRGSVATLEKVNRVLNWRRGKR